MTKEVDLTNFVKKFIRYATDTKSVLEDATSIDVDICNEHYFVDSSQIVNFALDIIHVMKALNPHLNITYEIKKLQSQASKTKWLYFTFYSEKDTEKFQNYDANQDDFYEDYETDKEMRAKLIRNVRQTVKKLKERWDVLRGMS